MSAAQMPQNPEDGANSGATERRKAWLAGLLVFVLALAVRLALLEEVAGSYLETEDLITDVSFYVERAREIANGDVFGRDPGYLSPIYCGFLGLVYACGGELGAAKIVQAILSAASCVLVFALAQRLFNWRVGALAGTVFALYGMHAFYAALILPTTLEVLFNLAFLVLAIPGARPPSLPRYLAAGAVLGLAIGVKPNALLLIPLTLLWIFAGLREFELARRMRLAASLCLGVFLTVAPLTWRNHQVSGEFVLVSVVGGRNLLKGNGPDADGSHVFLPPSRAGVGLNAIRQGTVAPALAVADDREKQREALEYMLEHPGRALQLFGKKLFLMFNARELSIRDHFDFARTRFDVLRWLPFTFAVVAPIGLVGMAFTLARKRFTLVHLMILVQVVSFVLVFVLGRYRLVMVACLAILGAGHAQRFTEALKQRERRTVLLSLVLWAAFALPALLPVPGFPAERGWVDQYRASAVRNQELGRWEEAIADWNGALATLWTNDLPSLAPPVIHVEIARCQLRLSRPDAARRALEQAQAALNEFGPGPRYAALQREIEALYEEVGGG